MGQQMYRIHSFFSIRQHVSYSGMAVPVGNGLVKCMLPSPKISIFVHQLDNDIQETYSDK